MNETTKAVRGVGAEVRKAGFSWRAEVTHLGGGGTRYFKFNGRWIEMVSADMPQSVYRALRTALNESIKMALPKTNNEARV